MRYKLVPLFISLALLAACGGDKKDTYDYTQIAGSYQIVQEDVASGPRQITVYLVDHDTNLLVVRDTLDKRSVVKGTQNEHTGLVTFADGSTCSDKAAGLSCALNGIAVDIPAIDTEAVSLASLAGSYQVLSGKEVYQVAIASDGKITGTIPCALSGNLSQQQSPKVNRIQLRDCQAKELFGVLEQVKVDTNTSLLEVYLPDSGLSEFWVKL